MTGPGGHPPSEVDSETRSGRVEIRMRLPVHVWAMLSCGREAESCEVEPVVEDYKGVEGIGTRERWREQVAAGSCRRR